VTFFRTTLQACQKRRADRRNHSAEGGSTGAAETIKISPLLFYSSKTSVKSNVKPQNNLNDTKQAK
jgi:hypothetical protein